MAFKEQESKLNIKEKIYDGEASEIFRLEDGRIFKKAKSLLLNVCANSGIDYEGKLLSTCAASVEEIVSPISVVYTSKYCTGFTMEEVIGPTLNEIDDAYTLEQRCDLGMYYEQYSKIESVVRRANKVGVVMPDLATCDNIIMLPDGGVKFLDYDGMQFGRNDKSIAFSTSLQHIREYLTSTKFMDRPYHFTKELDITSLTILMFLDVFNINLNMVGVMDPFTRRIITLDDVFNSLGLDDDILKRKVAANLSLREKGTYLVDDLKRVMNNYKMETIEIPSYIQAPSNYVKKLIHK